MKHSVRGNIDPFIVMDVMEKARKAEEIAAKLFIWRLVSLVLPYLLKL